MMKKEVQQPPKIRYVLTHVIDPTHSVMVGLLKLRGPQYLLEKISVPGGKCDPGEDVMACASRELEEETGLVLPTDAWQQFECFETNEYVLHKLYAITDQCIHAQTVEDEPVFLLDLQSIWGHAQHKADNYTPDFFENLKKLDKAVHFKWLN